MPSRGIRCGGLKDACTPPPNPMHRVSSLSAKASSTLIGNTDRGVFSGNPTTGSHCECPGELRLSPSTRSFEGYAGRTGEAAAHLAA